MIISCEKCGTSFNLDEKVLQPAGSKVRCSRCNNIFTAYPPPVKSHEEAAEISTPVAAPVQHKPETEKTEPQDFNNKEIPESYTTEELKQDLPLEEAEFEDEIGDLELGLESEEKEIIGESPADNEFEDIDLELNLEEDEIEKQPVTEPEEEAGDLNLELDMDEDTPVDTLKEEKPDNLNLELEDKSEEDFELDIDGMLEMEEEEIVGETPADNEFEDIDLELNLEEDEIEKQPVTEPEEEAGDIDFELNLDEIKEETVTNAADQNFELDLSLEDSDNQDVSTESDEAQDQVVDLSDMEDVLELDVDEKETQRVFDEETAELDLELFEDSESEDEAVTEGEDEEDLSEEQDIDLTELEKMLDIEDLPEQEKVIENQDEFVPEIIIDDNIIEENEEADEETPCEIVAIEPDIDEAIAAEGTDADLADIDVSETGKEEIAEPEKIKRKEKKKTSKPILILFIIVLIAGAAYGAVLFLEGIGIQVPFISGKITSGKGVNIPYVTDLMKPVEQDTEGRLSITPLNKTIEGKYFKTSTIGSIFVITGQIKNDYDHPRSNIQIFAKIYAPGDVLLKKKKVYCGNIIKEDDLENLTKEEINKKIATQNRTKKYNFKVSPGKTVPFMAVFFNLPDNMKTFSVEVAGSSK